jgi:glycosyltransferase involved in cell wall biosynthesis
MLLSIVIPTHNRFVYLQRCLEALCAGDGRGLDSEIIVVDDCSKKDVAEKNKALCAGLQVGYHYCTKNRGAAAARNRGIELCSGEWIAFLDDDVCAEPGWRAHCETLLRGLAPVIVGVEGTVVATGSGVWDKEVENTIGGLYLSCHILYRRETLEAAGRFDEHFSSRYPSCEDHELAIRMLLWGAIVFSPELRAQHLPRRINILRYCRDSFYRMRSLLDAELYFYLKHRDRYHSVRHAGTFWGTYQNIVLRYVYSTVRRRKGATLAVHPLQTASLLLSCALEQAYAVMLSAKLFRMYQNMPFQFFRQQMDENRTRDAWKIAANASVADLTLKPRLLRSLLFPLLRLPVYSMGPFLQHIRQVSSLTNMRVFLRIDDVFFENPAAVTLLCDKLGDKGIPYCAGITGNDLTGSKAGPLLLRIQQSGGRVALHGFTHAGTFGPFKSELLQMNFPEMDARIEKVFSGVPASFRPKIFIPPYNAISREQLFHLANSFNVICGGPETARFTDYYTGPVALSRNAWYFPSFHPFYDNARTILKSNALRNIPGGKGFLCITVHLPVEAKDDFSALMNVIEKVRDKMTSWDYFCPALAHERDEA